MWQALESFVAGANVPHADTPEMRRVKEYLDSFTFSVPHAYDLVLVDPETKCPLYLGGVLAFYDKPFMRNMKAVVTVMDEPIDVSHSVRHMYIKANDDTHTTLAPVFEYAYKFIEENMQHRRPVFVHCRAGMSRSATIVLYYLMRKYHLSLMDALVYLKSRRPIVRPNNAFLEQLANAENVGFI